MDLHQEHAELMAESEKLESNWYRETASFEQKREYFRELIQRFGAVGVYVTEKPSQPVAWGLRKTGMYLFRAVGRL